MSSSIFGKLTHYNTFIHRMDPRLKIFALISLMVACFLPYGNGDGYYSNQFLILGILFIVIVSLMILARVSFVSFFKSLGMLWFMMIFLLIIMVFVPQGSGSSSHIMHIFSNGYTLYWDGFLQCAQILLRLIMMLALTLILTSTTAPMDITFALEWYLSPLKLIKFPTQIISMTLSLALRFIPTLLDETRRIMRSQKSRGVEFNRGFVVAKIKSVTTLIIPLLASCFSKADELALAMDARGYDPYAKRSRYKILSFHFIDLMSFIFLILLLAFFIAMCVLSQAYGINFWEDVFNVYGGW